MARADMRTRCVPGRPLLRNASSPTRRNKMLTLYSRRCSSCSNAGDSSFSASCTRTSSSEDSAPSNWWLSALSRASSMPSPSAPATPATGSDSSNIRPSPRNDSDMAPPVLEIRSVLSAASAYWNRQSQLGGRPRPYRYRDPCCAVGVPTARSSGHLSERFARARPGPQHPPAWFRAKSTLAVPIVRRRAAPGTASSSVRPPQTFPAIAPVRAEDLGCLCRRSSDIDDLIPTALHLENQGGHFRDDFRIIGDIGERQPRQHVYIESSQVRRDFLAAFHIQRVIELVDQADRLAQRPTLGNDIGERQIVVDACHAALRCRQMLEDLLEHDLHQSRGTGLGHQSVAAHCAVLSRSSSLRVHG